MGDEIETTRSVMGDEIGNADELWVENENDGANKLWVKNEIGFGWIGLGW